MQHTIHLSILDSNIYFMSLSKIDQFGNRFFAAAFVLAMLIPLLRAIDKDDELVSKIENRALKKFPELPVTLDSLIDFPKEVTDYYSDHFGYRKKLMLKHVDYVNWLGGDNRFHLVTQGKDGWLFLGGLRGDQSAAHDPIRDAMNINVFTKEQLDEFAEKLSQINSYLKERKIHFTYMVTPNKHTLYFDKLPNYVKKVGSRSALDQLLLHLRENTDVHVVDVRKELFQQKEKYQLYYKQDSHWNYLGANYAQFKLVSELKAHVLTGITPTRLDIDEFKVSGRKHGDLLTFSKLPGVSEIEYIPQFTGQCALKHTADKNDKLYRRMLEVCDDKKGVALVYRDSFFEALRPYVSRQFNTTTYLWRRPTAESLKSEISDKKPNVVIYSVVERELPYVPSIDLSAEVGR